MAFNIVFYKNTAETNVLNKYANLTLVTTQQVVFKEGTDIVNPIIILKYESSNFPQFNYAYIAYLKRYYYITDIVSVINGVWEIHLQIDVLYTYKDFILAQGGIVDRQEFAFNPYIIDDTVPIRNEYNIYISRKETDTFIPTDGYIGDYWCYLLTGYKIGTSYVEG